MKRLGGISELLDLNLPFLLQLLRTSYAKDLTFN